MTDATKADHGAVLREMAKSLHGQDRPHWNNEQDHAALLAGADALAREAKRDELGAVMVDKGTWDGLRARVTELEAERRRDAVDGQCAMDADSEEIMRLRARVGTLEAALREAVAMVDEMESRGMRDMIQSWRKWRDGLEFDRPCPTCKAPVSAECVCEIVRQAESSRALGDPGAGGDDKATMTYDPRSGRVTIAPPPAAIADDSEGAVT